MTSPRLPRPVRLPATALAARHALIDAANAEMCAAKTAALVAYERVHPVGHTRCTDRCHEAHRELDRAFSDANAAYQAALPRID